MTSILTENKESEETHGLSYDTLTESDKREIRESWNYWGYFRNCSRFGLRFGNLYLLL